MQLMRPMVAVALAATLTSCALDPAPAEEGSFASGSSSSFPTPSTSEDLDPVTYDVPDAKCPKGWTGLQVSTDGGGDVKDLDDVVACTDGGEQRTYLENKSKAVWLLSAATVTPSIVTRGNAGPGEISFVRIVRETRGQEAMAPGAAMTANVPPNEVSWAPDVPLTFGWEAHVLAVGKLRSINTSFASDALTRQNLAGNTLVACTLAVHGSASSATDLAQQDAVEIVRTGLGSDRCRAAAARAGVTEVLTQLRSETQRLKAVAADLTAASASSLGLPDGAQLRTR